MGQGVERNDKDNKKPVIGSAWIRGLGGSGSCACPPPPPGTPLWVLVEAAALSVLVARASTNAVKHLRSLVNPVPQAQYGSSTG
jgi:hypothetical protein